MENARGFEIEPGDIPNRGFLFADHQRTGRSGHGLGGITELADGRIISFYSNTSGELLSGHGTAGWSEYRISEDGGKSWGEPAELEYSKQIWQGENIYSALVCSVITAPDGNLVALVSLFENERWRKKMPPVCLVSPDGGLTWAGPKDVDASATVEDISLTFDASFVLGNEIFVIFMGGASDYCPGPYSLYVSEDNGNSFKKRSELPFNRLNYYSTAGVLENGDIIAYSYPYREKEFSSDAGAMDYYEKNIHYTVSPDKGRTWSPVRTAHFARGIRNPQLSEKIGDYYFVHGRGAKSEGYNLVLYSSRDGINWDGGTILYKNLFGGAKDCYSVNAAVKNCSNTTGERLLIQSSIAYDPGSFRVNICHWWVKNINGKIAV